MGTTTYLTRKAEGRCTKCGVLLTDDRKGKSSCAACSKKNTEYKRLQREQSRALGICPRCNKNKLFGDEKNCPECRAINYIFNLHYQENNRELRNEMSKTANKKRRERRKAERKCIYCDRDISNLKDELMSCEYCRAKNRIRQKKYRPSKPKSEYLITIRKQLGVCPQCGEKTYLNYGLCKKHYEIQIATHDYSKSTPRLIKHG